MSGGCSLKSIVLYGPAEPEAEHHVDFQAPEESAPGVPETTPLLIRPIGPPVRTLVGSANPQPPKPLLQSVGESLVIWYQRFSRLSAQEKFFCVVITLLVWTSSTMMIFGINFWLWSFQSFSDQASFTAIALPALIWAGAFILPLIHIRFFTHQDLDFLFTGASLKQLAWIGFFDSLGGLFSIYATKHVAIFLQTMIYAMGPMYTFLLWRFILREGSAASTQRFPIQPLLAFTCTIIGVVVSAIPQMSSVKKEGLESLLWLAIFMLGSMAPCVYNVLQSRYTRQYVSPQSSHYSVKLSMLAGETSFQAVFTLMYFPLDAIPWFGATSSVSETLQNAKDSMVCIANCPNNYIYLVLYAGGYYLNHIMMAIMNHYSPPLAAAVAQLNMPINVFLLIMMPSWSPHGARGVWHLELVALVMLLGSCILYSAWEESNRERERAKKQSSTSSGSSAYLAFAPAGAGSQHADEADESTPTEVGTPASVDVRVTDGSLQEPEK